MSNVKDQELNKFRTKNNKTLIAVTTEGDVSGILAGISYDDIQASYPSNTTEIYTYLKDSVIVAQVEVSYSNSSKQTLTRARKL